MSSNILKKGGCGTEVRKLQNILNILADGIFGSLTEEAVKEFQRANGLKADGIVGPATRKKLKLDLKTPPKCTRNIKEIIIHCSATPEGRDYSVTTIRQWHKQRGFSDIGYHYVVYRDGSLHTGRNINVAGAHCTNHNSISIGICYIGGLASDGKTPKDTRTDAQKATLLALLKELKATYPQATIHGHNEFANKACPCFNAKQEYGNL